MVLLLAVAAAVVIFGVLGYRSGLVRRLVELAGLLAVVLLAGRLASAAAPAIGARTGLDPSETLVAAFAVVAIAGLIAVRLLGWVAWRTVRLTVLGPVDRWGGALAGAAAGWLLASILLVAMTQVPGGRALTEEARRQPLLGAVLRTAPELYLRAQNLWSRHGDELWERALETSRRTAAAADRPRLPPGADPLGRGAGLES
ncbi:MAG: CvpA family protein [Candidatus Krumholzibacteriia bacterium]